MKTALQRIYFSHPTDAYGQKLRVEVTSAIKRIVAPTAYGERTRTTIICPDAPLRLRAQTEGMKAYFDKAATCNQCIILPMQDGAIDAESAEIAEAFFARKNQGENVSVAKIALTPVPNQAAPIWALYPLESLEKEHVLSVDETRQRNTKRTGRGRA